MIAFRSFRPPPVARLAALGMAAALLLSACITADRAKRAQISLPIGEENFPAGCGKTGQPKCLVIKVFDVGQGSTAFALFPDGTSILFDAGGSGSTQAAAVNKGIEELMPSGNIQYLILSHADNDHTNLLNSINRLVPKSLVAIHLSGQPSDYGTIQGKEFFSKIYTDPGKKRSGDECVSGFKTGIAIKIYCYENNEVGRGMKPAGFPRSETAGIYSYLLVVNAGGTSDPPLSTNAGSLVAGISYGKFKIMFPGDAESKTQNLITGRVPRALWQNTSVYVMAHHGAGTQGSNAVTWLQSIQPSVYLTSSSRHEGWYHPNGSLIHAILNDPTLAAPLKRMQMHDVFSSTDISNKKPTYCFCKFNQSLFSAYTNGTMTLKVNKTGDGILDYEMDNSQGMDACPANDPAYC